MENSEKRSRVWLKPFFGGGGGDQLYLGSMLSECITECEMF